MRGLACQEDAVYNMFMKKQRIKLLAMLLVLLMSPLFAQSYSRGAILDPDRYEQVASKPVLLMRNYTSLPRAVSLRQFSPIPENQGDYGTCVGWSTAFAARTISESIAMNRTDRSQTSNSAFSAIYVYKSITNDPSGQRGACISDAMDLMKDNGIVRRLSSERTLDFRRIALSLFANEQRHKIADYVRLFDYPRGSVGTVNERVPPVKKSLSEGKPVVIGMNTPDSFFGAKDLWEPTESPTRNHGGHAMCVIGYDDDKYGGAFEIQNSWGTDWGNNGYVWIRYRDFAAFVDEAYEIIENLAAYREATQYAASIEIEVLNSTSGMPVTFNPQGFYRTRQSYPSGTEFKFLMTNKHPAYVYAFASDTNNTGPTRIFPLLGYSPVLDYSDVSVAWPGEYEWIKMDEIVGTDYLVVLYSKEALDINAIERRFAATRGTFPERVASAIGSDFIPFRNVQYSMGKMEFNASSTNQKAVFGLLLAIEHRAR